MTVAINAYTASYTGFAPRPTSGSTSAAPVAAAQGGDNTKVSDLAQALTGKAAALFNHMDAKIRSTLETMVRSGQVTAKDVVLGLDEMAKQAEFTRFIKENPLTEAERARGAELQAMRDGLPFGKGAAAYPVRQSTTEQMDNLKRSYEAGQISQEELDEGLNDVRKQLHDEIETNLKPQMERLNTYGAAAADQMNSVLGRKVSEYKTALAGRSTAGTVEEISTEGGRKALDKLYSHGLLGVGPKAARDAADAYARQADVAGLGPVAGTTPPASPAAATMAAAVPPGPTPATGGADAGPPDWTAALLSPKQQAGLELLRQAAENDKADKPGEAKGFWAAKYLLSGLTKN